MFNTEIVSNGQTIDWTRTWFMVATLGFIRIVFRLLCRCMEMEYSVIFIDPDGVFLSF